MLDFIGSGSLLTLRWIIHRTRLSLMQGVATAHGPLFARLCYESKIRIPQAQYAKVTCSYLNGKLSVASYAYRVLATLIRWGWTSKGDI